MNIKANPNFKLIEEELKDIKLEFTYEGNNIKMSVIEYVLEAYGPEENKTPKKVGD